MPPKRAYAPKDDFVVSDHELEGDGGARKKVKKMGNGSGVKGKGKGKEKGGKSGTMGEGKGVGALVGGGGIRDGKGEAFWEISGKRRITISQYSGKQMVNIREYYDKDGEMLPGKKGISLTLEQFNTVISLLPHIESEIAEKGESLVRPDYSGEKAAPEEDGEEQDEDEDGREDEREDEDEDEEKEKVGGKKNFEATSDEEG